MSKQSKPQSSSRTLHSGGPLLQVHQSIQSEVSAISPLVDKFMAFIKKCQCVPGSEIDVEISLREAVANGVIHGNHQDPSKYVYVDCCCVPNQEVSILVRDEGLGFNSAELPDPTAAEQLHSIHGRGIYLMKTLMDEVHFERSGTAVYMRKRLAKANQAVRRLL